jgi:hypothetical protein
MEFAPGPAHTHRIPRPVLTPRQGSGQAPPGGRHRWSLALPHRARPGAAGGAASGSAGHGPAAHRPRGSLPASRRGAAADQPSARITWDMVRLVRVLLEPGERLYPPGVPTNPAPWALNSRGAPPLAMPSRNPSPEVRGVPRRCRCRGLLANCTTPADACIAAILANPLVSKDPHPPAATSEP